MRRPFFFFRFHSFSEHNNITSRTRITYPTYNIDSGRKKHLCSNDIYYHPVPRLFEPPRETRIGLKNRVVQEIWIKISAELG